MHSWLLARRLFLGGMIFHQITLHEQFVADTNIACRTGGLAGPARYKSKRAKHENDKTLRDFSALLPSHITRPLHSPFALASLSPLFAWHGQKIMPALQADTNISYLCKYSIHVVVKFEITIVSSQTNSRKKLHN